jgi:hypothetical protein
METLLIVVRFAGAVAELAALLLRRRKRDGPAG